MDRKLLESLIISQDASLLEALRQMDKIKRKLLLITNGDVFVSLISIGDVQRAILASVDLKTSVSKVMRKNPLVAREDQSIIDIKQMILRYRLEYCPILSDDDVIVNIYFYDDLFKDDKKTYKRNIELPVVIMAGGLGTRLRPITYVIPKPLLPLGEQTIIERIIDSFMSYQCNTFYISANYKSELLEYYLDSLRIEGANLNYFIEPKPLGTAGSMSLLNGKIDSTFIVSNCDILIDEDYYEIYKYHLKSENEITVVSAIKQFQIPYGTLKISENGQLISLVEKPSEYYFINAGFYILEPHLLQEIPKGSKYHLTNLIDKLIRENRKVGVFPISEGSWMDIGQWNEYNRTSEKLGYSGLNV